MAKPQDPVRTAQGLTAALQGVSERLDQVRQDSETRDAGLKKYGRHNRWLIAADIVLTLVTTFAVIKAVGAADQASQNHQATLISCQSTNQARAQSEQLWTFVVGLLGTPRPGETAAERAHGQQVLAALRQRVGVTFMPRDCQAIARGEKP